MVSRVGEGRRTPYLSFFKKRDNVLSKTVVEILSLGEGVLKHRAIAIDA